MNKKRKKLKPMPLQVLPGMILFILLPCIALARKVTTHLVIYPWFPNEELQYDFFLKSKSDLLLILLVWMIVILILQRKKIKCDLFFWSGAGYIIFAVISTVLSADPKLSLGGMLESYESIWILIGYLIIFLYAKRIWKTEENRKWIIASMGIGAILQCLLGMSQLAGKDFWKSGIGSTILTIGGDSSLRESLHFTFDQSRTNAVYMGSYNPNYAGIYCLLMLPIMCAAFGIFRKCRILIAVICLGLIAAMVGSGSKTAMGMAAVMIVCAVLIFVKKKWILLLTVPVLLTGLAGYDVTHGHVLKNAVLHIGQRVNYTTKELMPMEDEVRLTFRGYQYSLKNIHDSHGDSMEIRKHLKDGTKQIMPVFWDMDAQCFRADSKDFVSLTFDAYRQNETDFLFVYYRKDFNQNIAWCFVKDESTGGYRYLNVFGKLDEIITAPCVGYGYERAFTGRGYIWGRTIPLLGNYLLKGSGPDTFTVVFPQQDYLAKGLAENKLLSKIISKPHNLYLQIWVQTGLLSLIALLIFWGNYVIHAAIRLVKLKKQNGNLADHLLEIAILFSVIGYLGMGLLNDSTVAIAPLFWAILGIGSCEI